jgi:hypothetical protein
VFTLPKGITAQELEIETWQIDAMLRHLWMFQLEIGEEEEEAVEEAGIGGGGIDPSDDPTDPE